MAVRVSFHGGPAPAGAYQGEIPLLGKDVGDAFDIASGEAKPDAGVTAAGIYVMMPDASCFIKTGDGDLVFGDAATGNRYAADQPRPVYLEVGDKIAVVDA